MNNMTSARANLEDDANVGALEGKIGPFYRCSNAAQASSSVDGAREVDSTTRTRYPAPRNGRAGHSADSTLETMPL